MFVFLTGPRTQKITFTQNKLPSSLALANVKPKPKPKPLSFNKPSTLHEAPLHKTKVKTSKNKDKTVKAKQKKPTHLNHENKGRPITTEDYGKLRKILHTLAKWQRQPHELSHGNSELKKKPMPSYKELRKILEDMTPEIVKKIANKIIAGDRTRLSDMKPLKAVHSLEVNLAASKATKDKDAGFKRVKVNNSNYKNWSKKGSNSTSKVTNNHEDLILEADAKSVNSSDNSAATKEKANEATPSKNDNSTNGSQVSSTHATQTVPKVQSKDGNKISKLPSLIPVADKGRKNGSNSKPHKIQDARKPFEEPVKNESMSEFQPNNSSFVHFVMTESKTNKKTAIPRTKIESPRNKTHLNETEKPGEDVHFQEKNRSNVNNGTKNNGTSHTNQTKFGVISLGPEEDVEEVFETHATPINNTSVDKDKKKAAKNVVKDSEKVAKTINTGHKRRPHKVLHVEAKWNGQINVKANWKDVDETEHEMKPKKSSSVKKTKIKPKKKDTRLKTEETSGEEEGSEEYKFDDSGSRNDLLWRKSQPLKEKSN